MALVCPACGTENRAVAKFCLECIGPLQSDFEPTQVVPRRASSESTALRGMPTALAEFASAAPASAPSPAPAPTPTPAPATAPRRTGAAEPRKGLWLSVAAFAITLLVGAGGWMIAGAGGWYIYTASAGPAAEDAPAVAKEAVLAPAPPAPPVIADPTVLAPVAAAPLIVAPAVAPAASASPASVPAARPTSVAKVRPAAREVAPRTAMVNDPATACADLGFLGKARCMAAQCAKSEFRGKRACQAVLAHQRLMEEKRNPSLAN